MLETRENAVQVIKEFLPYPTQNSENYCRDWEEWHSELDFGWQWYRWGKHQSQNTSRSFPSRINHGRGFTACPWEPSGTCWTSTPVFHTHSLSRAAVWDLQCPIPAEQCPTKHRSGLLWRLLGSIKKTRAFLLHTLSEITEVSSTAWEWYFTKDLQKNSYRQKVQTQGHNNLEIIPIIFPKATGFLLWCYPNNL